MNIKTIKPLSLLFILSSIIFSCTPQNKWERSNGQKGEEGSNPYIKTVNNYRDSLNAVFMSGMNKVIPTEKRTPAHHLQFFDVKENYRISAQFTRINTNETFIMETNTDRKPVYRVFGKFVFEVENQALSLKVYQDTAHSDVLFCPFKDLTNGKQSYGAGRYLNFTLKDTLQPIIDFNYAYNPYCAYNPDFSCPIPPSDNHLQVQIPAGEMKWK